MISAALVVFVLRTRLPLLRSQPSKPMLAMTLLVVAVVLALPYSPLAAPLGFQALPLSFIVAMVAIVGVYLVSAEVVKAWFYRHND